MVPYQNKKNIAIKMVKRNLKTNGSISEWLKEHGDQEIDILIEKTFLIIEKVHAVLELKAWSKRHLSESMCISHLEVSKWFSGMHNLTIKNIIKMEIALGTELIYLEPLTDFLQP